MRFLSHPKPPRIAPAAEHSAADLVPNLHLRLVGAHREDWVLFELEHPRPRSCTTTTSTSSFPLSALSGGGIAVVRYEVVQECVRGLEARHVGALLTEAFRSVLSISHAHPVAGALDVRERT